MLCYMMGLKVGMITYVQISEGLASQKLGRAKKSEIWSDFGQLSSLIANILEINSDIKNRKQTCSIQQSPLFSARKW